MNDQLGAWLAAAIVGLLTVFSDKIIGRIRLSLNRADLRVKYFEELAVDLSTFVFMGELMHEYHSNGWTEPESLDPIIDEFNGAITTLRKKEYVYRSWVARYWKSDALEAFAAVMRAVKSVDRAVHAFNDEGDEASKVRELQRCMVDLQRLTDSWLTQAHG